MNHHYYNHCYHHKSFYTMAYPRERSNESTVSQDTTFLEASKKLDKPPLALTENAAPSKSLQIQGL
jgi:hypothetical protein